MRKPLLLFCDFDGTITEQDNIVAIMRQFAPPEWEELVSKILGQQISIREGVGQLFALLSSSIKQEIIEYIMTTVRIRAGFAEFVDYCQSENIKLLITSGGIDFFVHPILQPYHLESIYCNESDFSREQIVITWPHRCDETCDNDCGMCKATIIRSYDPTLYLRVLIGDSITDLAGAKISDFVIARSFLEQKCIELNLPFRPFHTFYDVIKIIKDLR